MGVIVVGIDGSEGAARALAAAVREATIRGDTVRAVAAWCVSWSEGVPLFDPGLYEEAATKSVHDAVAAVDAGDIRVESIVREGPAARVLLEEARNADLLVLGSRGLGGFKGLLLGSVSQACAHHTPCPLLIVPSRGGD